MNKKLIYFLISIIALIICIVVYILFEEHLGIVLFGIWLWVSQAFSILIGFITSIPVIGPIFARVIILPIQFVVSICTSILNFFFTKSKIPQERVRDIKVSLILLIGICIGFLLSHFFPYK